MTYDATFLPVSEIQWLGVFIQDRNKCSIPQQCLLPLIVEGIKDTGNFKHTRFSSILVSSTIFPGPNTLGMPFVRADLDVDGVNVPYFHPRATKMALLLKGKIYLGFVDLGNRFFAKVLEKGEFMVLSHGMKLQKWILEFISF
ncbi:Germin-like protein 2-4 [Capsicum chinense]|nr:Germin-like protein 2-4 [Capsicum chinense]